MAAGKPTWTDQQVEEIVGNLLRGDVLLAAVVVTFGCALYLRRYGATLADYRISGSRKPLKPLKTKDLFFMLS